MNIHNLPGHADMKGMTVRLVLSKPRLPIEQPISEIFGLGSYTKEWWLSLSVETNTRHTMVFNPNMQVHVSMCSKPCKHL